MTWRGAASIALAVFLSLTVTRAGAEILMMVPTEPSERPDRELLALFEEAKKVAERLDPPEISLGPAWETMPEYR